MTENTTSRPDVQGGMPRRRFLDVLGGSFLSLWGLGIAALLTSYLRTPHGERVAERQVHVGPLDEMRIGEARLVRHGTSPFFVIRRDAETVIALSAICTHVRCVLDYDSERRCLVCPCHDGRFDLGGNVLSGPPPRPLPAYNVAVRAGEIYVTL